MSEWETRCKAAEELLRQVGDRLEAMGDDATRNSKRLVASQAKLKQFSEQTKAMSQSIFNHLFPYQKEPSHDAVSADTSPRS